MAKKKNWKKAAFGITIFVTGMSSNNSYSFLNMNIPQINSNIIKAQEITDGTNTETNSTEIVNGVEWSYKVDYDRIQNVFPVNKDNLPEEVIIPDELGGLPVTSIGENAFSETKVKSITIPDTVTNIGDYAFADCPNLTKIKMPSSAIYVGKCAFRNCKALTDVLVEGVAEFAFEGCINLKTVKIPDSTMDSYRRFEAHAFKDCTSLGEVYVGAFTSTLDVYSYTFENCTSLKKVNFGEAEVTMNKFAFIGCSQLSDLTFNGSVTCKVDAFKDCTALNTLVFEKDAKIAYGSFRNCTSLREVTFNGNAVYSYVSSANSVFDTCTSLKKVVFNGEKAEIAFDKNEAVEEIIYNNTKTISGGINGLKNLKKLVFNTKNPQIARFTCSDNGNFTLEGYMEEGDYAALEGHNTVYQWAKENNIDTFFKSLGTFQDTTNISSVQEQLTAPITEEYLVTFDGNGGLINGVLSMSQKEVVNGKTYGTLTSPTRKGYIFNGWYTQPTKGKEITEDTKIELSENIILYAQWSKISVAQGKISKLVNTKPRRVTVSLKKVTDVDGYEILYSDSKDFADINKKILSSSVTSYNINKLRKGQKCYVKVRAYKLDSSGNKIYGKYSAVNKITVKK